ncbi:hypothetical protein B0H11DRAFT_1935435 [Mycena galericulata]|nr:hypothetical protein B0H11DRAFT_1935435 [Mycena galericulata]
MFPTPKETPPPSPLRPPLRLRQKAVRRLPEQDMSVPAGDIEQQKDETGKSENDESEDEVARAESGEAGSPPSMTQAAVTKSRTHVGNLAHAQRDPRFKRTGEDRSRLKEQREADRTLRSHICLKNAKTPRTTERGLLRDLKTAPEARDQILTRAQVVLAPTDLPMTQVQGSARFEQPPPTQTFAPTRFALSTRPSRFDAPVLRAQRHMQHTKSSHAASRNEAHRQF